MTTLCECGCGIPAPIAKITSAAKGWRQGEPVRFVRGHTMRPKRRPLESWWDINGDGCWIWNGGIMTVGYGLYHPGEGRTVRAHRYVYEQYVGPIPDDMTLDHLCRIKACVNPGHLEVVTQGENTRRFNASRTHCKHGHEFTEDNVYLFKGHRHCRACRKNFRRKPSAA